MEFKVSGQRAFRLEPNTNGAPNIIAGSPNNAVELGVVGATIAGGGATNYLGFSYTNRVAADTGTIGGGARNTIQTGAAGSTIGGGYFNTIEDNSFQSTIGAGSENTIQTYAFQSTIGGGYQNTIQNASFAVISGGVSNTVAESGGTIGGGQANRAFQFATISGGRGNVATPGGAIGGGFQNTIGADSYYSAIFGGYENIIGSNSVFATIAGGNHNTIQDKCIDAAIGGGSNNTIGGSALEATIGGGIGNRIQGGGNAGTICGGVQNTIQTNALWGTIPGGFRNLIGGSFCFAAGRRAIANHDGTFAWADSTDFDFSSTATNEFAVRATGGVRFVSGVDSNGVPVAGVSLPAGGGSWATLSDRNAKTHFTPVNPRELLDRLAQLPIQSWHYKSQSESVRHIGPTAQDFHSAFAVGEDDKHIATVDADGVALAAIQALNQKLEAELNHRDVEIRALRQQLDDLKTALGRETTPTKGGSQ